MPLGDNVHLNDWEIFRGPVGLKLCWMFCIVCPVFFGVNLREFQSGDDKVSHILNVKQLS